MLALYQAQLRQLVEDLLTSTASGMVQSVDAAMAKPISALNALALSWEFDNPETMANRVRLLAEKEGWLGVVLTDRTGHVTSLDPLAAPVPDSVVMDTDFVGSKASVSDLMLVGDLPFFVVRVPIKQDGQAVAALGALIPAADLSITAFQGLPVNWLAVIGDRNGIVVARSRNAAKYTGRPFAPRFQDAWQTGTTAIFDAATSEEIPSYGIVRHSTFAGWWIAIAAPKSVVEGHYSFARISVLGGGATAALLSVLLFIAFTRVLQRGRKAEATIATAAAERAMLQRLADIGANLPGVIYRRTMSPSGAFEYEHVSGNLALFGLGEEEREDSRCAAVIEAIARQDQGRWLTAVRHSAAALEPYVIEGRIGTKWVRSAANVTQSPDGTVVWDGVALDITDLRETEMALRESQANLHLALANARAGVWTWDFASGLGTWSPEVYALFGVSPDVQATFQGWLDLMLPPDRPLALQMSKDVTQGQHQESRLEYRIRHPQRGVVWVLSVGRVVESRVDGAPLRMTGVMIDITERKQAEVASALALEEARSATLAKSRFLAAASHDLRQPIQSLMLFTHALAAKLHDHPARMIVAQMLVAQDAFKSLLDSLLDLTKLDAGLVSPEVRPMPLAALLDEMAAAFQMRLAENGLRLKVRGCDAWLATDRTLLTRILSNLLDNALKYTVRGGVILACRPIGERVRIDVIDSGIGIPREHLGEIFREFVQLGETGREQHQGMGLGLATVKRLVDLLGHQLEVASRPGRGSRFSIWVPACAPSVETPTEPHTEGETDACRRVLVVDDDAMIRESMKTLLASWGYDPVTAATLQEALDQTEQAGPPAAIMADYRLGPGASGLIVIDEIRKLVGEKIPAALMTGDTGMRFDGEFTVLHKPVGPDSLRTVLARMLAEGRSRHAREAADAGN